VVKDVGQRGTEMIRSASWPLKERDGKAFERWQSERAAWAERKAGRKKGDDDADDPEPKLRRITTSDATIEAASQILADANDRHAKLTLICDELTGFFGSFGRYTPAGAAARGQWLQSYDGGPERCLPRCGPLAVDSVSTAKKLAMKVIGTVRLLQTSGPLGDMLSFSMA
jgi:hypothetical protein